MVAISVFMSTFPIVYAATTGVLMLIFLLRVQMRLEPYKYSLNNKLELEAVVTGTATLFSGVLFTSDDSSLALVVLFVLVIILILNIRYFLFWLFCMTFTLVERHELFRATFNMLAFLTCRRQLALRMIEREGITLTDHFSKSNVQGDSIPTIHKRRVTQKSKDAKDSKKIEESIEKRSKQKKKKGALRKKPQPIKTTENTTTMVIKKDEDYLLHQYPNLDQNSVIVEEANDDASPAHRQPTNGGRYSDSFNINNPVNSIIRNNFKIKQNKVSKIPESALPDLSEDGNKILAYEIQLSDNASNSVHLDQRERQKAHFKKTKR